MMTIQMVGNVLTHVVGPSNLPWYLESWTADRLMDWFIRWIFIHSFLWWLKDDLKDDIWTTTDERQKKNESNPNSNRNRGWVRILYLLHSSWDAGMLTMFWQHWSLNISISIVNDKFRSQHAVYVRLSLPTNDPNSPHWKNSVIVVRVAFTFVRTSENTA